MVSIANVERSAAQGAGRRRGPFYLGGAIDVLLGLDLLLFGGWIAGAILPDQPQVFGVETATILRILGAALLVVGLDAIVLARSTGRLARLLPAMPALNWAFAAAMILVLALGYGQLSAFGVVAAVVLAAVGAGLAIAQSRAL